MKCKGVELVGTYLFLYFSLPIVKKAFFAFAVKVKSVSFLHAFTTISLSFIVCVEQSYIC